MPTSTAKKHDRGIAALGALVLLALGSCGCGSSELRVGSGLTRPARELLLLIPRECTGYGAAHDKVMRTERSPVPVCPGSIHWDVIDGMKLDVDRYGTIVELRLDRIVATSADKALARARFIMFPSGHAHHKPFEVWHLVGSVERVLKGSAPLGPVEFPAVVQYHYGGLHHREYPDLSGGWLARCGTYLSIRPVVPGRVVAFLPTPAVRDARDLGCVEGHVVPVEDEPGKAYLGDLRLLTDVMGASRREDEVLDAKAARELLGKGGLAAGYYVAEHAGSSVALEEISLEKGPRGEVSASQLGLVEGLLRIRYLTSPGRRGRYEAVGWRDVDWDRLDRKLLEWAIVHLDAPEDADADTLKIAAYVLHDGVCRGTVPTVAELGLSPDVVAEATRRLASPSFTALFEHSTFEGTGWPLKIKRERLLAWLAGAHAPPHTSGSSVLPLWHYFPGQRIRGDWAESEKMFSTEFQCCGATCAPRR